MTQVKPMPFWLKVRDRGRRRVRRARRAPAAARHRPPVDLDKNKTSYYFPRDSVGVAPASRQLN